MAQETLIRLGAYPEMLDWVGDRDIATAWAECHNGEWMLWLCQRLRIDGALAYIQIALECGRLHQQHDASGTAKRTLDVVERWLRGEGVDTVDVAALTARLAAVRKSESSLARSSAQASEAAMLAQLVWLATSHYDAERKAAAASAYGQAWEADTAARDAYVDASKARIALAWAVSAVQAVESFRPGRVDPIWASSLVGTWEMSATADIVRKHIPFEAIEKAWRGEQ